MTIKATLAPPDPGASMIANRRYGPGVRAVGIDSRDNGQTVTAPIAAVSPDGDLIRTMSGSVYRVPLGPLDPSDLVDTAAICDRVRGVLDSVDPGPAAEVVRLRAEVERLTAWLSRIEGGDNPVDDGDAATLRRWAYEAVTLGREVSNG